MPISGLPLDFPAIARPTDPRAPSLPAALDVDLARGVATVPGHAAWRDVLVQAGMARMVPEALRLGAWPDVRVADFVPGGRPGWPGVTRGVKPVPGGYEIALAPAACLMSGALLWPWEHAHRVLDAWAAWLPQRPAAAATAGRLLRAPAVPSVDPRLRGRAWVVVELAIPGAPWIAAGLLAELRRLRPAIDTVAYRGTEALLDLPVGMPSPRAAIGTHIVLAELSAEALDAFVAVAGPGSGSDLLSAELHPVGSGAAAFAASAIGAPVDGDDALRLEHRLARLRDELDPWTVA
jgi:hypothetical protein